MKPWLAVACLGNAPPISLISFCMRAPPAHFRYNAKDLSGSIPGNDM
jgi:hypothetical protein